MNANFSYAETLTMRGSDGKKYQVQRWESVVNLSTIHPATRQHAPGGLQSFRLPNGETLSAGPTEGTLQTASGVVLTFEAGR